MNKVTICKECIWIFHAPHRGAAPVKCHATSKIVTDFVTGEKGLTSVTCTYRNRKGNCKYYKERRNSA